MSSTLIDGLAAEAADAMRRLLQEAYERGFREALAGAPIENRVAPSPAPASTGALAAPVAWSDELEADEDVPDEVEETEEQRRVVGIAARASVGTLRKRIVRAFELDRFDIDVVICRRGDASRRQLKSTAQLSLYRREG